MSTVTQHDLALLSANTIRCEQARVKRRLAGMSRVDAAREVARILVEDPGSVGTFQLWALLDAIPGIGEVKIRRLLMRDGVAWWPLRRVRDLTVRQRCELADRLSDSRAA